MPFRIIAALVVAACSIAPAGAKDLPRGAAAPKMTGCEWAGPGYAKIEGSDTCVRVSGSVRAEYSTSTSHGGSYSPSLGQ